jgi:hypothetical protein
MAAANSIILAGLVLFEPVVFVVPRSKVKEHGAPMCGFGN